MQSEMRRPPLPDIERFTNQLDARLRTAALEQRRMILPPSIKIAIQKLKLVMKPMLRSGAMAMTSIAIIVAISATPAARSGDLVVPISNPVAAPNDSAFVAGENPYIDNIQAGELELAVQEADNSDIRLQILE